MHDNRAYEVDHLEIGFWEKWMKKKLRKFADDIKMEQEGYHKMIRSAIDATKNFHSLFDPEQHKDTVYFLYSSRLPARSHYVMTPSGGSLEIDENKEPDLLGDGRVPEDSAMHKGFRVVGLGGAWSLNNDHGKLLSDDKFGEFVENELKPFIEKAKAAEIRAFVEKDPELREEIKARKWIVSVKLNSEPLERELTDVLREVASSNVAVVAPEATADPVVTAKKEGRHLEPEEPKVAAALFESAWLLDPDKIDARTLNRLGYVRFREGRVNEAVGIFKKAADIAETKEDPYLTKKIEGNIYGNLGATYERADSPEDALQAYRKGAELGNPIAASNFERLEAKLE